MSIDVVWVVLGVAVIAFYTTGLVVLWQWFRSWGRPPRTPIPRRPDPRYIFRLVQRDDRAAYVRIMRATYAVALRDLSRSMERMQRTIGKALLPTMTKLADAIAGLLR